MTGERFGMAQGLDRSDVERLVTIEAILRELVSRMTSLNQDLNADSKILNTVQGDIARLSYELAAERQARAQLTQKIATLDQDMRAAMGDMRKVVDGNSTFRRDLMVGAGVGGTVLGAIIGLGTWLLGWWPAIRAMFKGTS